MALTCHSYNHVDVRIIMQCTYQWQIQGATGAIAPPPPFCTYFLYYSLKMVQVMFSTTTNVHYFINIVPPFSKSWIRHCIHMYMWQSQVENEHYSTVCGLIRLVISLECFVEITPDFLCPFELHAQ